MNKTVTLTFKRDELLYDIKNMGFVEGDTKKVDSEHERHQVMDVGEDGNVDRVTRVLDLTFSECVELCYPYSKKAVAEDMAKDDTLTEGDYVMVLTLPDTFSETTVDLIKNSIHELMVCRALADWMSITKKEAAADWEKKAEAARTTVWSKINGRVGRVRRKLNPF